MSLLAWIALGVFIGLINSKAFKRPDTNRLVDISLGVTGAMFGGAIFSEYEVAGFTGIDFYSLIAAAFCAILALILYRACLKLPV
ncbi:GlsB/YeaQ/YmgE family stress response membrane protein [Leeia oryzae]|uniref:GlsB/YeaQ/YmgE family stress response membrane protein n=1 Tax=Leeia oryzae TaxID=356662 RepID=UPI0003829A14|nr:GlsB/YeaQ/YmgE family stress response membrane protein [Leeia oryzae]